MQAFELEDKSKAGRRTIVALFLVDPNNRITSTRDVPPQQLSWHDDASGLSALVNTEVQEAIGEKREYPISLAHAKRLREDLSQERANVTEMGNVPALDYKSEDDWWEHDYDEGEDKNHWFHRRLCFFDH